MPTHKISFRINGELQEMIVEDNQTLAEMIRNDLDLTGTKRGCDRGDCGLCTVIMNEVPVKSCLILAVEADGKDITTIEGIAKNGRLTKLQNAFVEHGALQCGFCTPAFVLAAEAVLKRKHEPSREDVEEAISGILCRCTGYRQIVEAILAASRNQDVNQDKNGNERENRRQL